MAFSLGTLTAYVNQNKLPLITRTLLGSKTASLMNLQTGIKYKAAINILATTAQFQAGSCTWNASGTTSITQREIEVVPHQVMESLCIDDLNQYFINEKLKAGSINPTDIPFEQQYTDLKADYIASQLEIEYWQGDTTSWNANINKFNGWIRVIDTAAASVNGNPTAITTGTGITASNVVGIMNGIYALIPPQVLRAPDMAIFCGTDTFRTWAQAVVTANLFAYNGQTNPNFELVIPGTNVKVYGLDGLTGTNRIFAGRTSNFYIGTDLSEDMERFSMIPDSHMLSMEFLAKFKAGVQVAFPNEIVSFKLV